MSSAALAPRLVDLLRRARALVLDFDGTLVDSNPIKQRAFERCFAGFPERREEILRYCWNHHHTTRGEKFRYVYEQILRRSYTAEASASLHAQFDMASTQQIIDAPEIAGAAEFLRSVSGCQMTAVLSSTPHALLLQIIERRGWRELFTTVQGAPVDKAAWLQGFRRDHRLGTGDLIFFGDTVEDRAAARDAGCLFVTLGKGEAVAGEDGRLGDFTPLLVA